MAVTSVDTLSEAIDYFNDQYQSALSVGSLQQVSRLASLTNQINTYYSIAISAMSEGNETLSQEALDAIVEILNAESISITTDVTPTMALGVYVTPNNILIPVDSDGLNSVYTNATAEIGIFSGAEDTTDGWAFEITTETNITSSISDSVVTITELTDDTGSVLVTATKDGYSDVEVTIPVKRSYQGSSGGGTVQDLTSLKIQANDEGTLAGNTRGDNSVDLQTSRTSPDEVASGEKAVICGGGSSKASGIRSFVGGGQGHNAYGTDSAIAGGSNNTAQDKAFVGGGYQNDATGEYSFIGGGQSNDASTNYAIVGAGRSNEASGSYSCVLSGSENEATEELTLVLGGASSSATAASATVLNGFLSEANGKGSLSNGFYNKAETYGEVVLGVAANEVTGTSDTWVGTDPLLRLGNGTAFGSRSDALRVDKDGSTYLYSLKSGADQSAAGAATNELWIDTSDNSIKIGV